MKALRRARRRQTCPTCHGKGWIPFVCDCCGHQVLVHENALCPNCLNNTTEPCYEREFATSSFNAAQLAAYEIWRETNTPPSYGHVPRYFLYREGYPR